MFLLFVVSVAVSACSSARQLAETSPMLASPSAITAGALSAGSVDDRVNARSQSTVDLVSGQFTITTDAGDSLSGTYSGQASVGTSGHDTASMTLVVTSGTGALAGASGTLTGKGMGAFSGEGTFSLLLKGSLATSILPDGVSFEGSIRGTSAVSCVQSAVVITLTGSGSFGRFGSGEATLTHQLANAGCQS